MNFIFSQRFCSRNLWFYPVYTTFIQFILVFPSILLKFYSVTSGFILNLFINYFINSSINYCNFISFNVLFIIQIYFITNYTYNYYYNQFYRIIYIILITKIINFNLIFWYFLLIPYRRNVSFAIFYYNFTFSFPGKKKILVKLIPGNSPSIIPDFGNQNNKNKANFSFFRKINQKNRQIKINL